MEDGDTEKYHPSRERVVSGVFLCRYIIKQNIVCSEAILYAIFTFLEVVTGLENSTRPLVFTSVSGCRASEYFDISTEN